ncbi:porin PorA family protein [Mesorhizobium sp. VK9D]|uniref:porin PorA family protein n=1 Tax=Mesorhizobium australafricanum TaxID=3072311 RepID=UPI002A24F350|nr:porin PorA family protein [Mesorhizobium sp. VK9D]MDX8456335.1 porin PorA family protein [Mesorhizobium sp. VK9D]
MGPGVPHASAMVNAPRAWRLIPFLWVLAPPAFLIVAAAIVRLTLGPASERLPADYTNSVILESDSRFRQAPDAAFAAFHQKGRRVDQVLSATGDIAIVQSHIDWTTDTGEVNYQTTGLYGVDRKTRQNVAGYGDLSRSGQFMFPPQLRDVADEVWDPYYGGPRHLAFDRNEVVDGLALAVYRFTIADLDETKTYDYFPDVPERFGVGTDGEGLLWVEPVSGTLVDMTDNGHSFFVDPATGKSMGDFSIWQARYSAQSKADLFSAATSSRLHILAAKIWLPAALLALALAWLGIGLLWLRRGARPSPE